MNTVKPRFRNTSWSAAKVFQNRSLFQYWHPTAPPTLLVIRIFTPYDGVLNPFFPQIWFRTLHALGLKRKLSFTVYFLYKSTMNTIKNAFDTKSAICDTVQHRWIASFCCSFKQNMQCSACWNHLYRAFF